MTKDIRLQEQLAQLSKLRADIETAGDNIGAQLAAIGRSFAVREFGRALAEARARMERDITRIAAVQQKRLAEARVSGKRAGLVIVDDIPAPQEPEVKG
jgi:hypothetical protein